LPGAEDVRARTGKGVRGQKGTKLSYSGCNLMREFRRRREGRRGNGVKNPKGSEAVPDIYLTKAIRAYFLYVNVALAGSGFIPAMSSA
jgi:hypothetical protein